MQQKKIILSKGKDKLLRSFHPWCFRGAITDIQGDCRKGDTVLLTDAAGGFIAWGYYNPDSQIAVRLLDWNQDAVIDVSWWEQKILASIKRRARLFSDNSTDSFRLIHAESDWIPGLIADKYNDVLVVQFLTAGAEKNKECILDLLQSILKPQMILENIDKQAWNLENIPLREPIRKGSKDPAVSIKEKNIQYFVNLLDCQKTGSFLDQRENRAAAAQFCENQSVLDCFCYTGGFSLHALAGKAQGVTMVDSSQTALDTAAKNLALNRWDNAPVQRLKADVFAFLREAASRGQTWDIVILDPPKLAPTHKHLAKALRAYKDMQLWALRCLKQQGLLICFSCSSAVSMDDLRKTCAWASIDAECQLQVVQHLHQPEDHPVRLSFPEGEYLKGLICRKV